MQHLCIHYSGAFGITDKDWVAVNDHPEILDKHLGQHHLHEGLSNGDLAVGWLAYILSESDHRKSAVQAWANRIPHTLESFFAAPLRPHEFSDDRLGILLKNLAQATGTTS